jgi:hypothetical protein
LRTPASRRREILRDFLGLFSVLGYFRFWAIFFLLAITVILAAASSGSSPGYTLVIGLPFVAAIGVVHLQLWLNRTVETIASGPGPVSQEEADLEFGYGKALGHARQNESHGYFAEAAEFYEKALVLKPHDIFTRMALAGIYRDRLLMPEAALRHFKTLVSEAPRDSMMREDALLAVKVLVRELKQKAR